MPQTAESAPDGRSSGRSAIAQAEERRCARPRWKDTDVPLLRIPGFVDAHCHGFQRALRGRDQGGDFWAWREEMLALAASLTVEDVRREYAEVYRELRANGYTAVGEFHYLGFEEARAAAEAAAEAGIELTLLYACPPRGGIPRCR